MSVLMLYFLSLMIALALVAGGVIFLFKQKTVVNDKGEVTSVEIPILGKIKSNYPSVGICMIGAGLAVYTISRLDPPRDTVELATSFSLLEEAQANGCRRLSQPCRSTSGAPPIPRPMPSPASPLTSIRGNTPSLPSRSSRSLMGSPAGPSPRPPPSPKKTASPPGPN